MASSNSTNSTCVYDTAFHRNTDPNYNWTQAWDTYRDVSYSNENALQGLFSTKSGNAQLAIPGCFYLGTLNETKVQQCEKGGGMAVLTSYTDHIMDADVWFCALRGRTIKFQDTPLTPTDDDLMQMRTNITGPEPITCNLPSRNAASPRMTLSHWLLILIVGLTSIMGL